jgi:signal transduction histidine kinase
MSEPGAESRSFKALLSARAWLTVWIPILLITAAHYGTGSHLSWAHDVLRRLYYIPIVLGAFAFGLRGALAASIVTSILYMPHAFGGLHHYHHDPGGSIEKLLEIVVYNLIGWITGTLADREVRERLAQQRIARQLAESLEEVKLMEAQLVRSGKLRALGELTAGLAHEIKNPLASLKGAVEILSDEVRPDSPRRKMIDILNKELDRLAAVLERFLSFARPKSVTVTDICIDDVIEPVVALVEPQARKQDTRIRWDRCPKPASIRGDKEQLTGVVMNVVLNAVQAMPAGGEVTISSEPATRGKRQFCQITIGDEGPGVPEDLKDKIFDPFVTTKDAGSGLGLAIAARVVDAHDGLIEVGVRKPHGAEFRILLPARFDAPHPLG